MVCFSQVTWQNNYGGTLDDYGNHMVRTSDGGYISISTVSSNDLDISGGLQAHHGGTDIFILKMSNANTIEWKRCIGGSNDEQGSTIQQLITGDFIVVGHSNSNASDGDLPASKPGGKDICIFRITPTGTIVWATCYGTALGDETVANYASVAIAPDGNLAMVANTNYGHDGVGINSPGGLPGPWFFKINTTSSAKMFELLFGGSWGDEMFAVAYSAVDDTYVLVGRGASPDIPVMPSPIPLGMTDMIVTKINSNGTALVWSRMYGGTNAFDAGHGLAVASDGTIFAVGNANSTDVNCTDKYGGVWESDGFVVCVNSSGALQWTNCVGSLGTFDVLTCVAVDAANNPIVSGWINGSGGDITDYKGDYDVWVATLNKSTGAILSQNTYGGSGEDKAFDIEFNLLGNRIIGSSKSTDGDLTGNNGVLDIWIFEPEAIFLPIKLSEFKAILTPQKTVQLTWKSELETNSRGFEIERSSDGTSLEKIGFIKSKNANFSNYEYCDEQPLVGQSYYRLKQIDPDGKFTYTKILNINNLKELDIKVYPNPIDRYLNIEAKFFIEELTILDFQGRVILNLFNPSQKLDLSALPSGLYSMIIKGENTLPKSFILQKK